MKLGKILGLVAAASLFAVSAFATSYDTVWLGDSIRLQECGGRMTVTKSKQGRGRHASEQVNLVFKHVKNCSNFDILGSNGYRTNYPNQKLQGRDSDRSGSFTIPGRYIDWGSNYITVAVKSNSEKHMDKITVRFRAY